MWAVIGQWIAAIIAAILKDQRADTNAKNLGRAEGNAATEKVIKEIADAQAENNAKFRDLASVLERLRNDARAEPGSQG